MLSEYTDVVEHMKQDAKKYSHLMSIQDKHTALSKEIDDAEHKRVPLSDLEIEQRKKEKLSLKDEAYTFVHQYKADHSL